MIKSYFQQDKADHYGALNTKIPRPRVTPPGTTREEVAVSSRNLNDYLDAENVSEKLTRNLK